MQKADLLLRSDAIFTGSGSPPQPGYVAIAGNKIIASGPSDGTKYIGAATTVYDLGNRLVCPGFVDVHCFFTGYLATVAGIDLSDCSSSEQVVEMVLQYKKTLKPDATILAQNVKSGFHDLTEEKLDQIFKHVPVVLFTEGHESCYMNTAAKTAYGFTPETCWSESYWKLLKYLLSDLDFSIPEFKKYLDLMNSRGITSIKEMGFDDFYGFTEVLKKLEEQQQLPVRVHFMSQPVGAPMNLEYGKRMKEMFQGNFVRFSGYNQMTDGSISCLEGEMKEPYLSADTCCAKKIDWESIKQDVFTADHENFRFSLHAQGDRAIANVIDIFNHCRKTADGKLKNRHAITDLECSDPSDLERMGILGIIAEIYPQIMSISNRTDKLAMIQTNIGMERGANYWNRRKMADSNVVISCGTDLPLLYDDIPESIYHTVGGFFPEGGVPFNEENTLTIAELLKAWSFGGQYNLGCEADFGLLEKGKFADIAVFDGNLFQIPPEQARDIRVYMTIVDGNIVYKKA